MNSLKSDAVEQSSVPNSVSCNACMETKGRNFAHFLYWSESRNSETMLWKSYVHFFRVSLYRFTFVGSAVHFWITLKFHPVLPVSGMNILDVEKCLI